MIQCMHSACCEWSNVFITNNDAAGLQTHDCCTRHDCAQRLVDSQISAARGEGDRG